MWQVEAQQTWNHDLEMWAGLDFVQAWAVYQDYAKKDYENLWLRPMEDLNAD